jgi:beta-galactosidase
MGNSNGSLSDMWAYFEKNHYRGTQGGFIWEWLDHGIKRKTPDGKVYWVYGGDFGEVPHDANFVCDGIVASDRAIHPALWELKKVHQPVEVAWKKSKLEVRNKHDFTTLDCVQGEWDVSVEGQFLAGGKLPLLKTAPGATTVVALKLPKLPAGREAFLNVRFRSRVATALVAKGHIVADSQVQLTTAAKPKAAKIVAPNIATRSGLVDANSGPWQLAFDEKSGFLSSLVQGNREWLHEGGGPRLQLLRAAIDNDGLKLRLPGVDRPLGKWLAAGLDKLEFRLEEMDVTKKGVRTVHSITGRGKWDDVRHEQLFEFLEDGSIRVSNRVDLGKKMETDLPRIGVVWALPAQTENVRWYGRGPLENYSDRVAAAPVGVYAATVDELHVDYVMPQENGYRTDVRWVEIGNENSGLRFIGEPLLGFSASHYSAADLYAAKHTIDLVPRAETLLSLDLAQRGVGTGSCGPDTFPEYRLSGHRHNFVYRIAAAGE